jgi:hypothetical protein
VTETALAGLRFVRNQIGMGVDLAGLIDTDAGRQDRGEGDIVAWTWGPVAEPELSSLSPRGRAWELARYRAYQKRLAGHRLGETFERAASFLKLIAARAALDQEISAHAAR